MSKEMIKNSTEPKKVLHLDTISKPSPRNFFKFRTQPKKASYKTLRFGIFPTALQGLFIIPTKPF